MKTQAEVRTELGKVKVPHTVTRTFEKGYVSALMWVLEESEEERSRQIREATTIVAKRLREETR